MWYEHCRGGLAVRACDAHHLGVGVSSGELNFADKWYVLCQSVLYHRRFERNTGAFDDFVGGEDALHAVSAFLEGDALGHQTVAVFGSYAAAVAQEDVEALVFSQDGCSEAAFAGSEHYNAAFYIIHPIIVFLVLQR